MQNIYFFTGFPGFIATSLIKQLIHDKYEIEKIYLLVLPSLMNKAQDEVEKIAEENNVAISKFTVIAGDITKKDLGLSPDINLELQNSVTRVFHLAAIYDLAVPLNIAYEVNVNGTKNVNDWTLKLNRLERYIYFSTAYVSGKREGKILETELEMNQSFKNHYESTKYEAERLVRGIIDKVPITIIRPGVVKGHSTTGETIKFDGPYFILNFLDRLRNFPLIPYLGKGDVEGNFVPIDYIFDATIYLGHAKKGVGKTYHLTDPKPYLMKEVYQMLMEEYLGKQPIGTIPLGLSKSFLSLSPVRKWLRVEKEALEYFTFNAHYDCTQVQKDLEGSGIICPNFKDTTKSMVDFYRLHKNDLDKQLKIV